METPTKTELRRAASAVSQQDEIARGRLDSLSLDRRPRSERAQEIRDIAEGRLPANSPCPAHRGTPVPPL